MKNINFGTNFIFTSRSSVRDIILSPLRDQFERLWVNNTTNYFQLISADPQTVVGLAAATTLLFPSSTEINFKPQNYSFNGATGEILIEEAGVYQFQIVLEDAIPQNWGSFLVSVLLDTVKVVSSSGNSCITFNWIVNAGDYVEIQIEKTTATDASITAGLSIVRLGNVG